VIANVAWVLIFLYRNRISKFLPGGWFVVEFISNNLLEMLAIMNKGKALVIGPEVDKPSTSSLVVDPILAAAVSDGL
jgi:hypothetical protein